MKDIIANLALVLLLASTTVLAQPPAQSQPSAQAKPDAAQEARLQSYQAEVQLMKEFTQHLLATVYFALGTVIVVLVAMLGFGWYQNYRLYERDKEALRAVLAAQLAEDQAKVMGRIEQQASERFERFDANIAKALESTHHRISDIHLLIEASIFHSTHSEKTPRTDFMVFHSHVERSIGHVSSGALDRALSVMLDYVESAARIDPPTRTSLLSLANKVPSESSAFGERVRELLANKPT